jgi:hypothetical protein
MDECNRNMDECNRNMDECNRNIPSATHRTPTLINKSVLLFITLMVSILNRFENLVTSNLWPTMGNLFFSPQYFDAE